MAFNIKVYAAVLFVCAFYGCALNPIHEILQKPTYEWSIEDCRLLIANSTSHNFRSDAKIVALATPLTPLVVTALGRQQQQKNKLSEVQYQTDMDELMYKTLGMFVDWQTGEYVDKRGNYYRKGIEQLDSLMFLLSLKNKTWPCIPPILIGHIGDQVNGEGFMAPLWKTSEADWCYFPDISDLDDKIFLVNDRNDTVKPRFVWGKKGSILGDEETLFVMFPLWNSNKQLMAKANEFYLVIEGFDQTIRLRFDPSQLQ